MSVGPPPTPAAGAAGGLRAERASPRHSPVPQLSPLRFDRLIAHCVRELEHLPSAARRSIRGRLAFLYMLAVIFCLEVLLCHSFFDIIVSLEVSAETLIGVQQYGNKIVK